MGSAWTTKVEGGTAVCDPAEIRRALILFLGGAHELRGLPSGRGRAVSSDDIDAAVSAAESLADESVYWCLNPIASDADRASKKTVTRRQWFLIDVDTVKPRDSSSTDEEKAKAAETAAMILTHLVDAGWPMPVVVDSGNGWHLLYRVDLPNDSLSQQHLKAALYALGQKFDCEHAIVDRSTHDAPRISKLPGTMARKGDDGPDRPHRMSRITYEPDAIEAVSVDQIKALGGEPESTNGKASAFASRATDGAGLKTYVQRAIDLECGKVAMAVSGTRNEILNAAAFSLGTMAAWPEMDDVQARRLLSHAADRAGLGDVETMKTIQSGWNAGKSSPRKRPEEQAEGPKTKADPRKRLVVKASSVESKRVDWLWPNRIAIGFITLFAGRTGLGKSFVVCDFVSRLSTGGTLPDGEGRLEASNVLIISEDPYEYVLVPRLLEMKANLDRVSFLSWDAMADYTLGDIDMLEQAYREAGCPKFIAIDPPTNFLGGKDEHKNGEVRSVLKNLIGWLNTRSVACVLVTHVNKSVGKGIDAIDRIIGSVAWGTSARIAMTFSVDPNDPDRCLFSCPKTNLGMKAETLAYQIKTTDALARVEWMGGVDISADDAMNQVKRKTRGACAVEWLAERFRERPEWESDELKRAAAQAGHSKNALWSPEANALPIKKKKRTTADGEEYWVWRAEPGWPPPENNGGKVGNVGKVDA